MNSSRNILTVRSRIYELGLSGDLVIVKVTVNGIMKRVVKIVFETVSNLQNC